MWFVVPFGVGPGVGDLGGSELVVVRFQEQSGLVDAPRTVNVVHRKRGK